MTLLSAIFSAKAQQSDTFKILNPSEFYEAIFQKNVQLVDVRTANEFNNGAIQNAVNIDFFQQSTFSNEFSKMDIEQPVYLYCHSGNRSRKTAALLEDMGFKKIYDLNGGYMRWPFKN